MTAEMANFFGDFRRVLLSALDDLITEGALPAGLDMTRVAVEPPRDPSHGDLATNAAMVLAGQVKQNPMVLAEKIAAALQGRELATGDYRGSGFSVDAVKPGFLNIRLDPAVWHAQLRAILEAGTAYGDSTVGQNERVNVEFVSANPTGPMHVGHGRGAVVGDALAALLAKVGFAVHREYYINDAGAQVDALARSLYFRYQEVVAAQPESRLLHSSAVLQAALVQPEGFYPGEYLKDAARKLFQRDGEKWFDKPEAVWLGPVRDFAITEMMALIRDDLAALDVKLCQLVHLFDKGEPVRMSKRAGTFVTLRDVIDQLDELTGEHGKDVFRFIMLTRKNDQTLEFDFAKVTEQSKDNPVFYVQYAHARAASVMRHAAEMLSRDQLSDAALAEAPLGRLGDPLELALIRLLASWPRIVEGAAEAHEPHRIAFFLQEVAAQFHLLWTKGKDEATLRFLVGGDPELTRARLGLVRAVALVIASGLEVFGVEPVEEM